MEKQASEREQAVHRVLYALRSPLVLMSLPDREEVTALCRRFDITALDLVECVTRRARNS